MVVCFSTLTRNIRHRREEKVVINVPSKSSERWWVGEVPAELFSLRSHPSLSASLFFFNIAVFKDRNTPSPFIETFPEDEEAAKASKPDHIYMDAMGFGMGNCCLQVLFQICREAESSSTPVH